MKNIAIITARSGSKGLVDKNIKLLNDKHLIGYTIEAAVKSNLFDEIYVSTDSEKYAEISEQYGANATPLRPLELAQDTTSSAEVIIDVLNSKKGYDNFCLLQPTSPFRTEKHIIESYDVFIEKDANSVVSLVKSDKSPNIINSINTDGTIDNFLKIDSSKYRRQDEINYVPNGAIFWVKCNYYLEYTNFYEKKCYPYIMDKYSSVDIDDAIDFEFAQYLQQRKVIK